MRRNAVSVGNVESKAGRWWRFAAVLTALMVAVVLFARSSDANTSRTVRANPLLLQRPSVLRTQNGARPVLWGVTLDCGYRPDEDGLPGLHRLEDRMPQILGSLSALAQRPIVRVVFDEHAQPEDYVRPLSRLRATAYIMGELLDSSHLRDFDVATYRTRATHYFDVLSSVVDVWEIGNEVNGDWTSRRHDRFGRQEVANEIAAAYDEARTRGLTTAVTFYKDLRPPQGGETPKYEIFPWVHQYLAERVREGIDYALVSYYNDPAALDWTRFFERMAVTFDHSAVGFGEMGGGDRQPDRLRTIQALYGLSVPIPRYVGGYFYWYYCVDAVPKGTPAWTAIDRKMTQ